MFNVNCIHLLHRMLLIELELKNDNTEKVEELYNKGFRALSDQKELAWLATRYSRYIFKVSPHALLKWVTCCSYTNQISVSLVHTNSILSYFCFNLTLQSLFNFPHIN